MLCLECDIPGVPVVSFHKTWRASPETPLHPLILNGQNFRYVREPGEVHNQVRKGTTPSFGGKHRTSKGMLPHEQGT